MATRTRIISNSKEGEEPVATAIPSYGATTAPPAAVVTLDGGDEESEPLVVLPAYSATTTDKEEGPVFRDVWFAVAFWLHLLVMLWLGIFVAPAGFQQIPDFNMTAMEDEIRKSNSKHDGDGVSEEDLQQMEQAVDAVSEYAHVYPYRIFVYLVLPCLLISFLVSFVTTATIIRPCPKPLVYSTLVGSLVGTAVVLLSTVLASPTKPVMWMVTLAALAGVAYYVRLAWRIVPFAAVNLQVALEAIGRNWGMYLIAFVFAELGFLWNLYWLYVLVGVSVRQDNACLEQHPEAADRWDDDDGTCSPPPGIFLALLLSLYWTSTVLMNTVQTTVSGVVATWCFVADEADHCCSPAVSGSLLRSLTYSFGSICLGSLLQALVSVLRYAVENARRRREEGNNDDVCGSLCYCVLECLVRCLEDVLDYFNQWYVDSFWR